MTSVSHLPQVRIRRGPPGRERSRKRLVVSYCSKPGPVVVGVGGVGIDYLASVLTFPKPDQKLRTERLEAQGGGNCGNCLTAAARLGLECRVVSTVGNDSLGDSVVAEFEADGVHTQFLKRQEGAATPFTYIIVDEAGDALSIHLCLCMMLCQQAHASWLHLGRYKATESVIVYADTGETGTCS